MEIEFIKVKNPWGIAFGGNQNSFKSLPNGKRIKRCGCGLIAVCDMTLFLRKESIIPWKRYMEFVTEKAKALNITDSFGLPIKKVIIMLKKDNPDYDFSFIPARKLSEKELSVLITESLEKGFPVIIRVGGIFRKLPYKMNGTEKKMRWHYFTVTGIKGNKLTFCSWGRKGEMSCAELCRYFGVTGGAVTAERL